MVKVPRFAFEKFPDADHELTTHMKSVGEAMAIGRNFTEALQKALRSLEKRDAGFTLGRRPGAAGPRAPCWSDPRSRTTAASRRSSRRCGRARASSRCTRPPGSTRGSSTRSPCSTRSASRSAPPPTLTPELLRLAKRHGFSDAQIGAARGLPEDVVRGVRHALGIRPVYKTVDTCAAEFAARTPYHYSAYDEETEVEPARAPGGDHPRARARTGSARGSSSTTPACTPR